MLNKRGEEGYGEMISGFIMLALIIWLLAKVNGWGPVIFWLIVIFGGVAVIGAALRALGEYVSGIPVRKAERQRREEELNKERIAREERERIEAERKLQQEERDRIAKERESYDNYKAALINSDAQSKLGDATKIIDMLQNEKDEALKSKIRIFFDKYLPIMTACLEAKKIGFANIDETIDTFTESVKAFSEGLYNVEDVLESNKAMLESLAIRDGLYDPYKLDITAEEEKMPLEATQ